MKDDNLRLRPLRIFDAPSISNRLRDEGILKMEGMRRPGYLSWFFAWWWIKKTYTSSFCIELASRPIGFIGLYDMRLGKSAGITLVIFDSAFRRHGYGTRAFKLLLQNLQRHSVAKKIFVEVRRDNHIALSFWRSLGFAEVSSLEGIINMSLDLNKEALFEA